MQSRTVAPVECAITRESCRSLEVTSARLTNDHGQCLATKAPPQPRIPVDGRMSRSEEQECDVEKENVKGR